jgi:hypothetical protein
MKFLEFMFQSLGHFFGMLILFLIITDSITHFYNFNSKIFYRFMRHLDIKKNGYPPAHCDADGDFKPEPKAENE